jgi:dTDP-4-dehydrorhamnose reductase
MKIIIVGASGRIGSKITEVLSKEHEIIRVGARSGDIVCDYTEEKSVGPFNAPGEDYPSLTTHG